MEYRPAKDAAAEWNVDVRAVQDYCKAGRVPGARKYGAAWMIPANAKKPEDKRKRKANAFPPSHAFRPAENTDTPPPLYPSLFFIENIRFDGRSAEAIAAELESDAQRRQFYAELAYIQGDMDKALALAEETPRDDELALCAMHIKSIALISKGDYLAYIANTRALDDMFSRYKARPQEAACIELVQASVITSLYAVKRCPEWFKNGDFSNIPAESRRYAVYAYARYLHASGQTERMLGVTEAALNLSTERGFTVTELYLSILRAIALVQLEQPHRARALLLEAFSKARAYRMYQPFSESISSSRGELDVVLKENFPEDYKQVLKGWNAVFTGWTDIHNRVSGASIPTHFTLKEHQIGLYLCEGFSHKEIAARMNLRPSTISNYVQAMRDKLGVTTSAEFIERMRWK